MQINTNWKIRPIAPNDIEVVATIIRNGLAEFGCVGEGYASMDPEIDDMYQMSQQKGCAFWVLADEAEKIIGCGGIAPLKGGDTDTCELQKLYFLEAARGKGYGRHFMEKCLSAAKDLGYQKCYLETVERMAAANAMYKKLGFESLCGAMGNTGHGSCDTRYMKEL
ncbi:MAG: GNAT family N-acetyltransferase [Bacteroidota bacterium]